MNDVGESKVEIVVSGHIAVHLPSSFLGSMRQFAVAQTFVGAACERWIDTTGASTVNSSVIAGGLHTLSEAPSSAVGNSDSHTLIEPFAVAVGYTWVVHDREIVVKLRKQES